MRQSSGHLLVWLCTWAVTEPDAMFTIKKIAGKMSKPTLTSLQHRCKLVGFLKQTGDLAIKLVPPVHGGGKWKTTPEQRWILETFSDADWMEIVHTAKARPAESIC